MEFENLLTLIKAVSDSELTGFKYEENGVKLNLTKEQKVVMPQAADVAAPEIRMQPQAGAQTPMQTQPQADDRTELQTDAQAPAGSLVKSPLVGTFYAAASEDAEPFVSIGDKVKKGQTLAIVEAMKLMNEIESEYTGTVVEILAENGQGVEYGQTLFRIEE